MTAVTGPRAARSRSDRAWRWLLNVAAIVGLMCIICGLVLNMMGARILVFSSGSMAPQIPAGAIGLTMPVPTENLEHGDVITVPRPGDGRLVTHRILELQGHDSVIFATLQGDANSAPDGAPYPLTAKTPRLVFTVPTGGAILASMKSPWVLGAIISLVVLAAVPVRPRHPKQPSGEPSRAERGSS